MRLRRPPFYPLNYGGGACKLSVLEPVRLAVCSRRSYLKFAVASNDRYNHRGAGPGSWIDVLAAYLEVRSGVMVELISSRNNTRIKSIRKLRTRPERDRTGTFLVEGIRAVSEAVQTGVDVEELIVAPDLLRSPFALGLLEEQQKRGTAVLLVSGEVFASISERDHPQGFAAIVRQRLESLREIAPGPNDLWVGLESVADPGNLGTILRTCDAVGGTGVILLGQSTDPFDPAAVRASMGAVFSQHIVRATADDLLQWTRRNRLHLAGTSPAATSDYQQVDYPSPLVMLMGSERHGLSEDLQRACNPLVRLPMVGRVDSLNLAVATGVVLYEIFNQRRRLSSTRGHGGRGQRRAGGTDRVSRPSRRDVNRPGAQG